MQMRKNFNRSSMYIILNHFNILTEKNLISVLRHPNRHVVCDIIRLLGSYELLILGNPQGMIDFILSSHHLVPYLAALKTLISYKLLNLEVIAFISQNEKAYTLADAVLMLNKYNIYSANRLKAIEQHPQQELLINLWTLLDISGYFNLALYQLTMEHPSPQILIDSLCLFQKMSYLNQQLAHHFFYCLIHNPQKPAQLIAENLIKRQLQKKQQSFKPILDIIEEETELLYDKPRF